jgi:hypothetical protein
MVYVNHAKLEGVNDHERKIPARGYNRHGKKEVKVTLGVELFDALRIEAKGRGWGIARMIRHLCESSIDGIE